MKNIVKTRFRVHGIFILFFLLLTSLNPLAWGTDAPGLLFGDSWSGPEGVQQPLHTVSGKVTDVKGQPLPGVTIIVKGNIMHGTITNADGKQPAFAIRI